MNKEWYNTLNRAPWNPPSWVFGVVWPILYLLMGISLLLVWTNKKCYPYCKELIYFFIQLVKAKRQGRLLQTLRDLLIIFLAIVMTAAIFYIAYRVFRVFLF